MPTSSHYSHPPFPYVPRLPLGHAVWGEGLLQGISLDDRHLWVPARLGSSEGGADERLSYQELRDAGEPPEPLAGPCLQYTYRVDHKRQAAAAELPWHKGRHGWVLIILLLFLPPLCLLHTALLGPGMSTRDLRCRPLTGPVELPKAPGPRSLPFVTVDMTTEEDSSFTHFGSVHSPYSFRIMFLSPDALCSYGWTGSSTKCNWEKS